MTKQWTFEKLAAANKPSLEKLMRESGSPDIDKLAGLVYCGWNHDAIGKLTGEKFKKGFYKKGSICYGYNETVAQDKRGYTGSWDRLPGASRPFHMGYFRVAYTSGENINASGQYHQSILFNYNIPDNKWYMSFFRLIRDFVVLPNHDDHSLMLGKAFLQLWGNKRIACCYFLLGHPEEIQFMPAHLQS